MSKVAINKVTNSNVYLDGRNLLGRAMEVTLPDIDWKMQEHKGLGMIGTIEVPAGGLDKMSAKFKWASYYPEVLRAAGNPRTAVQLQVRASLETYTGQGLTDEVALIATLGGVFRKSTFGSSKQHEGIEPETELAVHYFKLVIGGEVIVEVDVMNNIHKVGGVDILARFRSIIGG